MKPPKAPVRRPRRGAAFRFEVLQFAKSSNLSIPAIAAKFNISRATMHRWAKASGLDDSRARTDNRARTEPVIPTPDEAAQLRAQLRFAQNDTAILSQALEIILRNYRGAR